LLAAMASLARPLPAEIRVSTQSYPNNPSSNPAPTQANMDILFQAIYRLAGDPRLANHPIRRYLNDPSILARIVFDNPRIARSAPTIVMTDKNQIIMQSNKGMSYYLASLVHEFIHIETMEKYGNLLTYNFLTPEDYAFNNIMEEAFCMALESWARITYPEIPSDRQIRDWRRQMRGGHITDAMRNDFKAEYPNYSDERINNMVAEEMFHVFMTRSGDYTSTIIPNNVAISYGRENTFLIPDYAAYRAWADALMRHRWNYLASMMPFSLRSAMTYDYYRGRFMGDVREWANHAASPEKSILYWINYDYVGNARARLAGQSNPYYNYLPREDEERLNRVMLEIDPYFTPVNTGNVYQRVLQERQGR